MSKKKIEWDGIIHGGPYLEVSFLLIQNIDLKYDFIKNFLKRLESLSISFQFTSPELHNTIIKDYDEGYLDNPEDLNSTRYHTANFPLVMNFKKQRHTNLKIDLVGPSTVQFDFIFYGGEFDEPEWDQFGIRAEDFPEFVSFFEELQKIYTFELGIIGYEIDCTMIFEGNLCIPSEWLVINKFDPLTMEPEHANVIFWKGKYLKNI
jgi:hypothetical protein